MTASLNKKKNKTIMQGIQERLNKITELINAYKVEVDEEFDSLSKVVIKHNKFVFESLSIINNTLKELSSSVLEVKQDQKFIIKNMHEIMTNTIPQIEMLSKKLRLNEECVTTILDKNQELFEKIGLLDRVDHNQQRLNILLNELVKQTGNDQQDLSHSKNWKCKYVLNLLEELGSVSKYVDSSSIST